MGDKLFIIQHVQACSVPETLTWAGAYVNWENMSDAFRQRGTTTCNVLMILFQGTEESVKYLI